MTDKKEAPEGSKSKMRTKKKFILALLGVTVLAFSGYHLNILLEAKKYNTTYTHMKQIKSGNEMWERIAKEHLLYDKDKTF
ncbi:MAG: hypothetical protein JKX83_06305 [Pseudomonadales bacterium]|nr:hypothetical protein [Pseudomonadales bacterium]